MYAAANWNWTMGVTVDLHSLGSAIVHISDEIDEGWAEAITVENFGTRNDATQESGQTPDKEVEIRNITVYVSGCNGTGGDNIPVVPVSM